MTTPELERGARAMWECQKEPALPKWDKLYPAERAEFVAMARACIRAAFEPVGDEVVFHAAVGPDAMPAEVRAIIIAAVTKIVGGK